MNELVKTWLTTRPQLNCGLVLRTPTLRDIVTLDELKNPITYGVPPASLEQLLQFLYIMSTDFVPDDTAKRDEWLKKWLDKIDAATYAEIHEWWSPVINYMRTDKTNSVDASVAPYVAYYVYTFCTIFSWSIDYVLDRPILQLYQLLKIHRQRLGIADYVPEYDRLVKELESENPQKVVN